MILLVILALAIAAEGQNGQLSIRAGVSQLQMGELSQAKYTILFDQQLPDSVYNSMVSVSYANSLDVTNGIVVTSACPNTSQTSMGCTVRADSLNQNNIVYVSYLASDVGSLLVGNYQQTFSFEDTTSLSTLVTFKPQVNSEYINSSNVLYVNFYPFIAGVSTLDADFSLTIDKKQFDVLTFQISVSLTIKEMHVKNVTITLGYILYDSSQITVSLYSGQRLTPDNVASGYIYGIGAILPQTINGRRLQVIPTKPAPTAKATPSSGLPSINAYNTVNVFPTVTKHGSSQANVSTPARSSSPSTPSSPRMSAAAAAVLSASSSKSAPPPSPSSFIPPRQSSTAAVLRSYSNQVVLTAKAVNSTLMSAVMQPDGVLDANEAALSTLKSLGVIPYQPAGKRLAGIDNQLFNSLFSTNGFVILTAADDVDQIYYYQVNPVQNFERSGTASYPASAAYPAGAAAITADAAPATVYYASTVTNAKQVPACRKGVIVGILRFVDYVQEKMVLECISCQLGMYFDLQRKVCEPFPVISNYFNQFDTLL